MFQQAHLNEIVVFIAVAEHGSFTKAAASLNSTKSGTGKAVKKLEEELGLKLFNRTTRSIRLTEEGKIFLDAAKHAIETINDARLLLNARKDEPAGRLRINLPIGIGRNIVSALKNFTQLHPKVTVEVSLSDSLEDAIRGEWDVVVRIGKLEDSSFIAKTLCESKRILCASPKYLSQKGKPKTLEELREHDALVFRAPTGKVRAWSFRENDGSIIEFSPSPLAIFRDGRTLIDAVVSGMGIAQVYDKALDSSIQSGEVVELFPEKVVPGPPVSALIPSGRAMPAKTRVFIDFLKNELN
ncbi:LysR family transcriptional regulator [Microbulbifer sp. MLAF003]|uniref:LysR family transcriptional regulator n=1 Tax=Microbulbifer TaxID=48073 RepID=UPI00037FC470|nr:MULTISPECIES: LysR family transcriptional regulator [Microbulbifer]WHI53378.1 LysR family transcriptional regulator [Microbulbifer sp. MLAF003]